MSGKNLKQEIGNAESAKFIDKAKIESNKIMQIPDGAKYFRLKSGEILYFQNKANTKKNGYKGIPKNATSIEFPYYTKRFGFIEYGKPIFQSN